MKKFTDTQKKWALTATMIAALGCSVSFNSGTQSTTLDLASEAKTVTDSVDVGGNKVIHVRLSSTTDKRTVVEQSPATDAEGKATFECNDCRTYIVAQPLGDGKEVLEAVTEALKMKYSKKSVKEAVMEAMDVRSDEGSEKAQAKRHNEDLSEDEQIALLMAESKRCNGISDDYTKSTCRANSLVKSLKANKNISQEVASQYYRDEISDGLATRITEFSTLKGDTTEDLDDSLSTIKTLMKQLPKAHKLLRYELASTSAQAFAQKYEQSRLDAINNPNLTGRIIWDANFVQDQLYRQNQSSLNSSGLSLADAEKIFQHAYNLPVQAIINQRRGSNQNINGINNNIGLQSRIPGVVPAPGFENQNLNSRSNQNNLGRENLSVQQGSIVLSDGTVLPIEGVIPAGGTTQVDQSGNGPQAIVILRQNTSNGVQFGQLRELSDQTEQARLNMRSQQSQHIWARP